MKVVKDENFLSSLQDALENIAKDSITQAVIFDDELNEKIDNLKHMPLKFRQSPFHDDKNIRDLIYKAYVIPYLVDEVNQMIIVLNIFKNRNY